MSEKTIGYLHEGFDQETQYDVDTRDGLDSRFHDGSTLYDQNESNAGDQYDLASGVRFDSSTATDETYFTRHDMGYVTNLDEAPGDEFQGDAADKWLKMHEAALQQDQPTHR